MMHTCVRTVSLGVVALWLWGCDSDPTPARAPDGSSADASSHDAGPTADASLPPEDAASGPNAEEVDWRALLETLVEDVFVPSYAAFEQSALELRQDADAMCNTLYPVTPALDGGAPPEEAGAPLSEAGADSGSLSAAVQLNQVRARWERARSLWKQADAFSFGPYRDQPWRIGPKLDSYPVVESSLDAYLVEAPATADELATQGTRVRGLPVMEYLLYGPGDADATVSAFRGQGGYLRCRFLQALGQDTHALATQMSQAWEQTYADEVTQAGAGSDTFESVHDAVSEIVNRLVFTIENLRVMKVGKPAGIGESEAPLPELFESRYSDRAQEDARDALLGVWQVYSGERWVGGFEPDAGEALGGLHAALAWRGPALNEAIIQDFEAAFAALEDAGSFALATEGARAKLEALYEALRELQLAFGVDVAAALGVTVTFNDTDGD